MRTFFLLLRRHWRKVIFFVLLLAVGGAYASSPLVRARTHTAWHAALAWAEIGGEPVDTSRVFWCPMHPQIKSSKENAVCPICNMALVELEGGIAEAPQHLTLTAQQVQQAGVVTQPVMLRKLYREIDTTGRVAYDERRLGKITSWVRGKSRIDKLYVDYRGMRVESGQPLVELYSPELITAQQEFLSALRRRSSHPANGLESDLLRSARQKLAYQGLSEKQIDELARTGQPTGHVRIDAPISGTVIKRHVQKGEYVTEGEVLLEIADLDNLWLFADVYEDELPLIEVGTNVAVSVAILPGETFPGEVAFIEPLVRPATRTVPVRIDLDNRGGQLLPGMFARVHLRHEFASVLAVPENAVLWSGERSVVVLRSGEGTFRPVEIKTGRKWLLERAGPETESTGFGGGRVRYHEVVEGLVPGDQVVTAGAFLLNAESQFQSVLAKMLPPHSERATLEDVLGATLAGRMRNVLDEYFALSGRLAEDDLAAVPEHLHAMHDLATELRRAAFDADAARLAADATDFVELTASLSATPITDGAEARTRFGKLSHELTKLLEAHGGKTLFGHDLYQFECGMANVGYERWLWWSPEIHNPYMGQKMLKCGTKLDVLNP